jgi:hypothetical protein
MAQKIIHGVDLTAFLWQPPQVNRWWASAIVEIDRQLRSIDDAAEFDQPGGAHVSGCTWDLWMNQYGDRLTKVERSIPSPPRWRVALSFRGPLLTALSWSRPNDFEDKVTCEPLVALVKKLATQLRFTYLDAHELRALEIPWDELQGDANLRLDWSDSPNAFNLLFYEY